jgi:hypothetical protein
LGHKPGCQLHTYDFSVESHNFNICMTCRSCSWQSAWVKEWDWKNFVFWLDCTLPNLNVFWYDYLAPKSLENLFIDVTEEVG